MKNAIIVGLGQTGLSCVKYLHKLDFNLCVFDTRAKPPHLESFKETYPTIPVFCATLPDLSKMAPYELVISPGVSLSVPFIQTLIKQAASVTNDIGLFAKANNVPIIAITGSNGKSTVTTLVGEMAKAAGLKPAVVGNIGVPVLSSLENSNSHDVIVMELSSFQLELLEELPVKIATVLNISADHLDRYPSIKAYAAAKHNIYNKAEISVINQDDSKATPINLSGNKIYFTDKAPQSGVFGLNVVDGEIYLCHGSHPMLAVSEMKLKGKHNYLNACAALAIGYHFGLPVDAMRQALREFAGLEHRCEWVAQVSSVDWFNDSKGTNVGACVAALEGFGTSEPDSGNIILILGGQGKGQDFSDLISPVTKFCHMVITMGESASELESLLSTYVNTMHAKDIEHAVELAMVNAKPKDIVLLSPACASFDQFKSFEHRGLCFKNAVLNLEKKIA